MIYDVIFSELLFSIKLGFFSDHIVYYKTNYTSISWVIDHVYKFGESYPRLQSPLPAHLFPFMNKKNNTNYCELLVVYGVRSESFT